MARRRLTDQLAEELWTNGTDDRLAVYDWHADDDTLNVATMPAAERHFKCRRA